MNFISSANTTARLLLEVGGKRLGEISRAKRFKTGTVGQRIDSKIQSLDSTE